MFGTDGEPAGWFVYSHAEGRPDAHCSKHAQCRMNRALRRGVIGLSFAWLLDCNQATNKEDHDVMKEIMSSREMYDRRQDCRNLFKAFADDAQYPAVIISWAHY